MGDKMQEVKLTITLYFFHSPIFQSHMTFFVTCYHREKQFDNEGTLLEEKPLDADEVGRRKKIAVVRNKIGDLIQRAKNSNEGTNFLVTSVMNIDASFGQIVPSIVQATQEEYESFISYRISEQVEIHPPMRRGAHGVG
jgi:hypothetical protein